MSNFVQPHGQQPISLLRPQDSLGKNTGEGCNSFSNDQPRKHIKKQRLYFTNKGLSSQSYGFSRSHVQMWKLDHKEGWALKNWCFQIAVGRRLLRVPWIARRSNLSILKAINSEYSLEGLMLELQFFGQLMWTVDSLEKTLMLGKIEGKRHRGQQSIKWLDSNSMDRSLGEFQKTVKDREDWLAVAHGVIASDTTEWMATLKFTAETAFMSNLWCFSGAYSFRKARMWMGLQSLFLSGFSFCKNATWMGQCWVGLHKLAGS